MARRGRQRQARRPHNRPHFANRHTRLPDTLITFTSRFSRILRRLTNITTVTVVSLRTRHGRTRFILFVGLNGITSHIQRVSPRLRITLRPARNRFRQVFTNISTTRRHITRNSPKFRATRNMIRRLQRLLSRTFRTTPVRPQGMRPRNS